jgi:aromatic amino acid aminotransferase I / 2-aminoadipate transaminase
MQLKIHFANHPAYINSFAPSQKADLEQRLFERIADSGVLVGPGRFFASVSEVQNAAEGHLRMSFSHASVRIIREIPLYFWH